MMDRVSDRSLSRTDKIAFSVREDKLRHNKGIRNSIGSHRRAAARQHLTDTNLGAAGYA